MKSTKRKRPPDEDMTSQLVCLRLRSQKLPRVAPVDEIVPESDSDPERERQSGTWRSVKQRLRDALCGDVTEYRPLLEKLLKERRDEMDRVFGEEYTKELSSGTSFQELPNFKSWFTVRKREPQAKIERSLSDLGEFPHVQTWSMDEVLHDAKRDAFARYATSMLEMNAVKARLENLKAERKKKTWKPSEKRAFDQVIQDVKKEEAPLDVQKELMLLRSRKYRLFPTKEQEKTLRRQSHFRKTNEFKAEHLRDLYVTKTSKKTLIYPEGMSPPPEWAFDTPKNLRFNAVRTFQTNVKSALSNKKNGNINKFKIGFSSKKRSPYFTMSEDGKDASIKKNQSSYYLPISRLKDIRVKMDSHGKISSEIDILNRNGFWYVAIPEYVQPTAFDNRDKCIALDPGIKAFVTGVDLEGNVLEFGRDTKTHLNKLRKRRNDAQSSVRESQAYVLKLRGEDEELREGAALPDKRVPDQSLRRDPAPDIPDEGHGEKKQRAQPSLQRGNVESESFPILTTAEGEV